MTENDKTWGPFTWGPWHKCISIEWNSGGGEEEDPRNFLRITGFGRALRIWLPGILKPWKEVRPSYANDGHIFTTYWPRVYGIFLSTGGGDQYDFLRIYYGAQTHSSDTTISWSKFLPWMMWDCVRHSLYHPDGTHYFTEPRDKKGRGNWDAFYKTTQEVPKVHFGFEDFDGDMRIASCYIEEREWHRGTGKFKWLKYFWPAKIRRSLDIRFDYEMGPGKGSWKGGTVGHGIDMLPGEFPVNAFKRYCAKEHDHKGKKFKIRYIGPSKPPEPEDIRVARNRGWKQCDYPHASAKDMWTHDDLLEGKYISTEEMLEFIEEERRKQNEQCGNMIKAS